jgi:hypothetical protein
MLVFILPTTLYFLEVLVRLNLRILIFLLYGALTYLAVNLKLELCLVQQKKILLFLLMPLDLFFTDYLVNNIE